MTVQPWGRMPTARLCLAMLAAAAAVPARAQGNSSRNCSTGAGPIIGEGSNPGKLEKVVRFEGGPAQMAMKLENRLQGTLDLHGGVGGFIEAVHGEVTWTLQGSGAPNAYVVAGMSFTGPGSLSKQGEHWGEIFRAETTLRVPASVGVTVSPPGAATGSAGLAGVGGGPLHLRFEVEASSCDGATGTFTSPEIQETISALVANGFRVAEESVGRWSVGGSSDETERKLREFRRKLGPLRPPGVEREAETARLTKIRDEIASEQPARVRPCLRAVWLQHASDVLSGWVREDIGALKAYQGDHSGLNLIIKSAISADRQVVLLGLDTCKAELHRKLWDGIERALAALIKRLLRQRAEPADILEVVAEAFVLGVISPELKKHAEESALARLKDEADAAWRAYLAEKRQAPRGTPCTPAAAAALQKALFWEKTYSYRGGDLDRALSEVREGRCVAATR